MITVYGINIISFKYDNIRIYINNNNCLICCYLKCFIRPSVLSQPLYYYGEAITLLRAQTRVSKYSNTLFSQNDCRKTSENRYIKRTHDYALRRNVIQ